MVSLLLKPDKLDIGYDEKSDVLYISFGKPNEADSIEPQDDAVLKSSKGEFVGITIVGLRRRLSS